MIEQTKYLFGRMFAKRTLDPDIVQTPKYIFNIVVLKHLQRTLDE